MAEEYCPEIRVDPPALEEVIRELDQDTKHIGRPTRSPRRPEWTADPLHFPSDARCVKESTDRGLSEKLSRYITRCRVWSSITTGPRMTMFCVLCSL